GPGRARQGLAPAPAGPRTLSPGAEAEAPRLRAPPEQPGRALSGHGQAERGAGAVCSGAWGAGRLPGRWLRPPRPPPAQPAPPERPVLPRHPLDLAGGDPAAGRAALRGRAVLERPRGRTRQPRPPGPRPPRTPEDAPGTAGGAGPAGPAGAADAGAAAAGRL